MFRKNLSLICVVSVAALLVAAPVANAATAITVEAFDTGAGQQSFAAWSLPTKNPSNSDYLDASQSTWTQGTGPDSYTSDTGQSITPPRMANNYWASNLNNGVGQANDWDVPASNWGTNWITIDLGSVVDVAEFNSYSWAYQSRQDQGYTLHYSAAGSAPSTGGDLAANGWTMLGTVATTYMTDTGNGHQVGVSFTDDEATLASARFLLMQVTGGYTDGFFGEVDVVLAEEGEVPEPTAINVNIYNPDPQTGLVGPAGGLGETWNQFNTTSASGLLDSTGAATTVGFTTTNLHGPWDWGSPSLGLIAAGRPNFDTGPNNSQQFVINGLAEGDLYDLWLASANCDSNQRSQGEWTMLNPTTSAMVQTADNTGGINGDTWELGNNYVLYENVVVDANGEIVLTGHARRDTQYDTRLPLNGFQLVAVPEKGDIPEPATMCALGLAVAGLGGYVRRRRKA